MTDLPFSQAAFDLCIAAEGCSTTPDWPGGASGVTIGYGYDLGYNTEDDLRLEWGDLPSAVLDRLAAMIGLIGSNAHAMIYSFRDVIIPQAMCIRVFEETSWPKAGRQMLTVFDAMALPPDCFGALQSLVYNRGTSLVGDRRREMAQIAKALPTHPELVPDLIRSMTRLWVGQNLDGLITRRNDEAALFKAALTVLEDVACVGTGPA
jgi:GH24 family phage-related lysozyme (muramidase)